MSEEEKLSKGQFEQQESVAEFGAQEVTQDEAEKVIEEAESVVDGDLGDLDTLQGKLEEAEGQLAEQRDLVLRLNADLQNQQRRAEKQVQDAHKFAAQKFVESILPVMDSLEMGLQAEGDLDKIREGMELTMKQFESAFEKFNIEAINPVNEAFNPELHQAMSMQNSPDHDNNTIIAVFQKGYSLNGRVVRPAMVVVCKK